MRRLIIIALTFVMAALGPAPASAQSYPTKPIRVIVPFAAGGAVDVLARLVSAKMSESVGQPVIIENRAGAAGNVAADAVAKSPPDGYTILQNTNGQAISPSLYKSLPFDAVKDFTPVTQLVASQLLLVATPSLPAKSVQELIALAKAQPGKLNYASAGVGSGIHLGTVLFAETAGIDLTHIPYKGSGPALTDLLGGHVQIYFSSLPPAVGLVKEGKLHALGVTGLKRSASFPDVPTVAEQGLPGFEAVLHYGIVAPAGTPRAIVDKLNAALCTALDDPKVRGHIATEGAEPLSMSPDEYAADIDREETRWSALVRKSNSQAK